MALSEDHKPDDAIEKARIYAAGGTVCGEATARRDWVGLRCTSFTFLAFNFCCASMFRTVLVFCFAFQAVLVSGSRSPCFFRL